jgi:hypothetical protein
MAGGVGSNGSKSAARVALACEFFGNCMGERFRRAVVGAARTGKRTGKRGTGKRDRKKTSYGKSSGKLKISSG